MSVLLEEHSRRWPEYHSRLIEVELGLLEKSRWAGPDSAAIVSQNPLKDKQTFTMGMDKCWFILPHSDVPPPTIPSSGIGHLTGPLCPGHLIPSPSRLDSVMNSTSGPLPIPPDMHIHLSTSTNFTWTRHMGRAFHHSAGASVPILAAAGLPVTAEAGAGISHGRFRSERWDFEKLETYTMWPTRAYLEDTLEDDEDVRNWVNRKKIKGLGSWEVYMITGVKVGRGAKMTVVEGKVSGGEGKGGLGLSGLAEGHLASGTSSHKGTAVSQENMKDFVWAVRLEKVAKGMFDSRWTPSRFYSQGAAFRMAASPPLDPSQALKGVGLSAEQVDLLGMDNFAVCVEETDPAEGLGRGEEDWVAL
ncbi:hypothetical protein B0T21DRAFT_353816 [Apiosordaria backusii]|uniref:Uncharacterized protein n=1 Tax=Apiosordaria backusii TaxID=314023 RepID=A0AA40DF58_9PEZI|nr:hypothetical protein B0T21DRAFT_353816 [Apiosordaria backusii]